MFIHHLAPHCLNPTSCTHHPRTLFNEVVAHQTGASRIAWRVSGNRTLRASAASLVTGSVTVVSPKDANLTNVVLTAAGNCSGACACTFDVPASCPPTTLAQWAVAPCAVTCSNGTANFTAQGQVNEYTLSLTGVPVARSDVDDATGCGDITAPLLTARAHPAPWGATVNRCSSFVTPVESTTPPPQPLPECDLFNQTYVVTSATSLTVNGSVVARSNATAVIPCPQAAVVTSSGYTRTKQWSW